MTRTVHELIDSLKVLKDRGFVKTHRSGNTGIGKTLEDLLGVEENNIPGPDGYMTELKGGRKNSPSMLTLFTKSPDPKEINSKLLAQYGYPYKEKKALHTTISATKFNTLKGKPGFKINITEDRVEIVHHEPYHSMSTPYWSNDTLRKSFTRKYPDKLLYVKADTMRNGSEESFHYNEAHLLTGFSFKRFTELLQSEDILADIRIGQYPDGRPHDHGTGFRIQPGKLDMCFETRERVL